MIEYVVSSDGLSKEIKVIDDEFVEIAGIKKKYVLKEISSNKFLLKIDNKVYDSFLISNSNGIIELTINQKSYKINVLTTLQDKALKLIQQNNPDKDKQTKIKSPMPGLVLKINKNIGDKVKKGETIMVLEAMKMENEIKSPVDGEISEMNIKAGQPIEKNFLLFSIK